MLYDCTPPAVPGFDGVVCEYGDHTRTCERQRSHTSTSSIMPCRNLKICSRLHSHRLHFRAKPQNCERHLTLVCESVHGWVCVAMPLLMASQSSGPIKRTTSSLSEFPDCTTFSNTFTTTTYHPKMSSLKPITLYSHAAGPNPWKVAIILEELGVPYHNVFPKVKEEPFLSINPNGRVPAIEDPNTGITLWESGAIITYLIDNYDKDEKISYKSTPEKYLSDQWLAFQISGQGPYFGQVS